MLFMAAGLFQDPKTLRAGKLLIAEPFLADPNFARTVILLCEHSEDGTVGFVMNRPTDATFGTLFPLSRLASRTVYQGGPVQLDTICILQRAPQAATGHLVLPGIYWGSDIETVEEEVATGIKTPEDVQFYLGYSGWGIGQLADELQSGTWLIADASAALLFDTPREELWRKALETLGNDYKNLANLPLNPQLN
ncbi:MAG: YqgE/AlgH family protein [Sphingobacteriales bacterium]|nr:MAG: YqgE/AlgH family protein [Sphingobacteriales bacterium]